MGGFGSGHGSGGKRKGAGRPPGPCGPQTVSLSFRFTAQECEALKARAASAGLSVTEYVKMRCLAG